MQQPPGPGGSQPVPAQPPMQQPPTQQPPMQQQSAMQQPPMQQPPMQQQSAMQPPPMQQPPMQQPPMQQQSAMQQPPMQQPPMQQPPMQQPPTQQPPMQQQSATQQPPMQQPNMQQPPMQQSTNMQPMVQPPPTGVPQSPAHRPPTTSSAMTPPPLTNFPGNHGMVDGRQTNPVMSPGPVVMPATPPNGGPSSQSGGRATSGRRLAYPSQLGSTGQLAGSMPPSGPNIGMPGQQSGGMNGTTNVHDQRRLSTAQPTDSVDLMSSRSVMPNSPLRAPVPPLPDSHKRRNCSSKIIRTTLTTVPQTAALLSKSRLPFGISIYPAGADRIPVVESTVITRCRVCRTYMNPFATFLSHGRRWRCNMCYRVHDLPNDFDYDQMTRKHIERAERPELNYSSVEYIAPSEYMVRPPQPCIYVFLIDVSTSALESGMVETVTQAILANITKLAGDKRTRVSFITYNHQVHFYNLQDTLSQPQMMVVPDIEDMFLPSPVDLVVNLEDSMDLVKTLLTNLPAMFKDCSSQASCLSAALMSARQLIEQIGGRITIFQSGVPSHGDGKITRAENTSERSTASEYKAMQPETDFYKTFSVDSSRAQIGIDLFSLPAGYTDIATLGQVSKFASGMNYHYPSFHSRNREQRKKVEKEIAHYLTRPLGLEAVLRVRCTSGLSMTAFHGHFFVRSADLLSLPNVSPDNSYSFQLQIEDDLPESQPYVYFQVALLYTSSIGERRIRVHTLALPTTKNLADVYSGADPQCLTTMLGKMAVDRALAGRLTDARDAIFNVVKDSLEAYRANVSGKGGQLVVPGSLVQLPLLALALLKHQALTLDPIETDQRAQALTYLKVLPVWELKDMIYPRLYPLHNMEDDVGIRDSSNRLPMPVVIQLSAEHLERGGIYLLHNSLYMLLYVTKDVNQQMMSDLFDCQYNDLKNGPIDLPKRDAQLSKKIRNIVRGLRSCHPRYLVLIVVKEDGPLRTEFMKHLLEDKFNNSMSYYDMLTKLQQEIK